MKDSLIDLIFEEYKQTTLFEELEKKGINLMNIAVDNLNIVFDLIGFPKENGREYDWDVLDGMPHNPKKGKIPDENLFSREWLFNEYFDIVSVEKEQKIEVTDKGLKMIEISDEILIKLQISQYVDWLYKEYYELSNNQIL